MMQCELCGSALAAGTKECLQCDSPAARQQMQTILQETVQWLSKDLNHSADKQPQLFFAIANFYRLCGLYDDAILWYEKAIEANPGQSEPFRSLATALVAKNEYRGAIEMMKKAVSLAPKYPDYHSDLGAAYFKEGHYDEAIAAFQEALKLNPYYANAHNNLGLAYRKKGKFHEALDEIKKAIELEPQYAVATYDLGLSYFRGGMFSQLQSSPRMTSKMLGDIYYLREAYSQASEYYRIAVSVHPRYGDLHYSLGCAYAKSGENAKAIESFQEALRINPNYTDAKSALEKTRESAA